MTFTDYHTQGKTQGFLEYVVFRGGGGELGVIGGMSCCASGVSNFFFFWGGGIASFRGGGETHPPKSLQEILKPA